MTEQEFMEQLIKRFKSTPISTKKKQVVLGDGETEEVVFESVRQVVLNRAGMPETLLVNKPRVLADGSSLAEVGVTRCQACHELIRTESIRRCACGLTCCLRRGCGKVWFGTWFCSFRCVILDRLGLLRRF